MGRWNDFLSALWKPRLKKSLITSPITTAVLLGLKDYTKWAVDDYQKYASEGYIGNHVVFSCINKIVSSASDIEILTYTKSDDPKEVTNEVSQLFTKPNPQTSWKEFCKNALSYLLIGGNCYIYLLTVGSSLKPRELWLLRPDCVSRNMDGTYSYESVSGRKTYQPEQILHIKTFNPLSDEVGLSPIQIAALSIDQNSGAKKWNAKLILNSGRPVGALASKEEIDKPTRDAIKARFKEDYAGPDNAGNPMILEGGLNWVQLGINPNEMEWISGVKMSTVDITAIFGVPPELIGYPEFRTYNNVHEAKNQFYEETVLPWLNFLLEQLNEFVVSRIGAYELFYNPDNIKALQENIDALWQRIGQAKNDGRLSLNEARIAMGYDPVPSGGDFIYGSMGQYPIASTTGEPVPAFEVPTTDVPPEEEHGREEEETNEPEE